ncbi:MAG: L-arabinose isomerase [Spirochaetes bacterium]|nr:L-arabinose isomerase [Spirochaetota bacterium]
MFEFYKEVEIWFATGSQHLYGEETLRQVKDHSQKIVEGLNKSYKFPVKIVFKNVVTTPDEITAFCNDASSNPSCIGVMTWMHTFSPAKMWIAGLSILTKPLLQLHTQFNRDIPWNQIDMDFMNLNQTAHGGREYGFIGTRLGLERKVVVGYWEEERVKSEVAQWQRVAAAWYDSRTMKIARFGDNMREVAVTEGNKVSAQIKFGYSVNGYGIGDLAAVINSVSDADVKKHIEMLASEYEIRGIDKGSLTSNSSLIEASRIELGLTSFLTKGGFKAFTTTFEDLHGLKQLPGLAVQRLMEKGFGFGAEGDWKTAALVRSMKVMGYGLEGGTSFMEDYTYNFEPGNNLVLGAHMLEVCPTIAKGKPSLEVHPLGIGGKEDPARLVFNAKHGKGLNATLIDLGDRFRMIINEVDVVDSKETLPKLPVARVVWSPLPDLPVAAASWIFGGGAHHTGFSTCVTTQQLVDFADIAGIEAVIIDKNTSVNDFKNQLKWNTLYYKLLKNN